MSKDSEISYWLVGAYDDDSNVDLTQEFLEKGVWTNNYKDRYLEDVRSIKSGDKIGIKSTYTKKNGLPFENRGQLVSAMDIKAVGTVTENLGDGRTVKVKWDKRFERKTWYFYTYRKTIWKINQSRYFAGDLIDFTFNDKPQDIKKFIQDPYWSKRYSDSFSWTPFYIEFATALLKYRNNRSELIKIIERSSEKVEVLKPPSDKYANGKVGPLRDICPFTFLALFNKGLTATNRNLVAEAFRIELGVSEPAPLEFPGIPTLLNQSAWFFPYEKNRGPQDIDKLWDLFTLAISFADADDIDQSVLGAAFDEALTVPGSKWNLTMGLYWIRPWSFVTMDSNSRRLLTQQLHIDIPIEDGANMISGSSYLELNEKLASKFEDNNFPFHSYPEISLAAWKGETIMQSDGNKNEMTRSTNEDIAPYGMDDIIREGGFISDRFLDETLETLRSKKNLILQGPPGTGKSWLAKRIAYALRGNKLSEGVISMQFHANMSYEDFIRGWRPIKEGNLQLADGPFLELISHAKNNPEENFVFVIEEINRGNPAQIFGEMLTLLENNKRNSSEALQLTYRQTVDERLHIPDNFYVIGTMNTADKSLAIMDFAFRRRFAFQTLTPQFNSKWEKWLSTQFGIDMVKVNRLAIAVETLNKAIREDGNLGSAYELGHSFFTPNSIEECQDFDVWVYRILHTEIRPLLVEYWYDEAKRPTEAIEQFLGSL